MASIYNTAPQPVVQLPDGTKKTKRKAAEAARPFIKASCDYLNDTDLFGVSIKKKKNFKARCGVVTYSVIISTVTVLLHTVTVTVQSSIRKKTMNKQYRYCIMILVSYYCMYEGTRLFFFIFI